ncbi:cobalamin B12-binding domain-containing protein [Micromonospora sp. NBC_01813]|uniref:cobalamin B12-binding domain-containing protein n=1 Tax=Micromonospora sp. NBC_01813 TaxID=2975988 RepID=UPI002DDB6F3A|nr:cobalamin-dependent protein [Micromonospora sp. NBC_01813]WSA10226.1 cobalamin B12-binding domain-containing protein [Micromonospora sp. NBC_01813]
MTVLVTGAASDSHTWNLMFLQLFVEEQGHRVVNLGPCVPPTLLADSCRTVAPDLVVLSSVNGHGYPDGLRAVTQLRDQLRSAAPPVVIGGKLGVTGPLAAEQVHRLLTAGFAAVFDGGDLDSFRGYLHRLAAGAATATVPATPRVDAVRAAL